MIIKSRERASRKAYEGARHSDDVGDVAVAEHDVGRLHATATPLVLLLLRTSPRQLQFLRSLLLFLHLLRLFLSNTRPRDRKRLDGKKSRRDRQCTPSAAP